MNRTEPSASVWRTLLLATIATIESVGAAYTVVDDAALLLQGVPYDGLPPVTIEVQWDQFADVRARFPAATSTKTAAHSRAFAMPAQPVAVTIRCEQNMVIAAHPDRTFVTINEQPVAVRSIYGYLRTLPPSDPRVATIRVWLADIQRVQTARSEAAWNQGAYEAWVERFGDPATAAARITAWPERTIAALLPYLNDVRGLRVAHLLGSNGVKAVAMALLGAQVTIFDLSADNARYGRELADAAGVGLEYVVGDVLTIDPEEHARRYDLVLLELGILHYFVDLDPLVATIATLLVPDGRVVLQDFHPIATKLIRLKGQRHIVDGNYFDPTLIGTAVAHRKHLESATAAAPTVLHRRWTLGEIVTAFACRLQIEQLVEAPNTKAADRGVPKTYTLVARRV